MKVMKKRGRKRETTKGIEQPILESIRTFGKKKTTNTWEY